MINGFKNSGLVLHIILWIYAVSRLTNMFSFNRKNCHISNKKSLYSLEEKVFKMILADSIDLQKYDKCRQNVEDKMSTSTSVRHL